MIPSDQQCDELLQLLHIQAMDLNEYDFGLPMFDPVSLIKMREIVKKAYHSWSEGVDNKIEDTIEDNDGAVDER